MRETGEHAFATARKHGTPKDNSGAPTKRVACPPCFGWAWNVCAGRGGGIGSREPAGGPIKPCCGGAAASGRPVRKKGKWCLTRPGGMVYSLIGVGRKATPGTPLAVHAAGFRKKVKTRGDSLLTAPRSEL